MSPFQKNFQRLLIFFFAGVSIVLVFLGVNRSKGGAPAFSAAPKQDGVSTPLVATKPVQGSVVFTGKGYQTPWGNAVASISVVNGKITGVTMPQVPQSPPSQYAESYLVAQALAAGSANIQGVSGATYTSIAFKSSLESAIAQAKTQGQNIIPTVSNTSAPVGNPSVPRSYQGDD